MFVRDVVFGRLPALILGGFWLDLDGFGPPSWGHVGSSWVSIGPQIAILGVFWAILAPCTGFELQQEQILERWRQMMPSWKPPGSILEAPGRDFGGFGRGPNAIFGRNFYIINSC